MHLLKALLLILFSGFLSIANAQQDIDTTIHPTACFTKEMDFVNYLSGNNKSALALSALSQFPCKLTSVETDSVNFIKGWIFYNLKQLDSSSFYFLKVSANASTYQKANFFAAYNFTYTKNYTTATTLLNQPLLVSNDSLLKELRAFEFAGMKLLQNDTAAYKPFAANFTHNYYALTDQEKRMNTYLEKIRTMPHRSPFVAGALSAAVPGLGRWYAGRKKQAIGSFFQLTALALLTLEAYNNHGLKQAPFYIYGTAFTIFYLSNIRGSAIAVKIKKNETQQLLQNSILFDMHIPLRTIFN